MNMQRRFGVLTAIAGAALALGSLTFAGSATATESSNYHDHDDHENITKCPAGTTQFDGQVRSGSGSTALFHWTVEENTYVTITQIDPSVGRMTAYIKGGDGYRVYDPVNSGEAMRSPTNHGGNVPTLSHWMLCYTVTPVVTTTTAPDIVTTTTIADVVTTTTIAEVVTTTTIADVVTTTTVPDIVTTTTIGESEGPTTTLADETTTTEQASEGPTTTVDDSHLPTTGAATSLPLVLGLAMSLGGVLLSLLARSPRDC